ncbi:ECF transporter S component [Staphylococcus pasteuri]|uniref:Energy-coupling factor transport system substrate-specific component n=2 Tax=Staphylococcus TaxID=1279 RepID=A0ABY1H384_9STAP|nr:MULTISPECIES: ECF transporter S component [Staphylococcus]ODB64033.1 thiamine ABC transporter permease [Staphylococcus sp. AOAB]RQX28914.1 thiamine ABC transporter permease [Staphylococcus warneri]ATH62959.1 thiamine ABC transporter permease [Staphylococcus pasteuri]KKI57028.1 Substrate-specific component YkoE of thiamin-regulated ECF transporter for HydroxyMethylPyrimidine [Staphylococcus pasteuri]MBM6506989.1 ECF transporter S component [Staphylococcus pasteuri]
MSKGLKLSEILVTVLISVIFAIIYNLWWLFYNVAQVAGLHLEQLTYGVWFMAAVVCYLIIPKPGIALLAEFAAGAGETIVMGKFDIPTIVYALLQGLACEIVFAIFKYQSRSVMVAILAGLVTALISFPVDYYYGYLNEVAGWNLILFIVFRALSGIIISGLLSYLLVKALDQTGVTKLFRPASKDDYDSL